ncbi:MAG: hypothetical protein CM15mP25_3040 [Gammaproteobacteria bacterium]|nr:MAG: hypothetical protein CM15mP25_3040 [Gammaproteobacteria bacterium]
MSDYKATLNLPQTDFPMKANLAQREPERLKAWAEMDLYGQMRQAAQGNRPLSCMTALPTPMVSSTSGMPSTRY